MTYIGFWSGEGTLSSFHSPPRYSLRYCVRVGPSEYQGPPQTREKMTRPKRTNRKDKSEVQDGITIREREGGN